MSVWTWANPDRIGIRSVGASGCVRYLDRGAEYEAAVAAGVGDYAGPITDPTPTPEQQAATLAAWRATAVCSPMQGKLALGADQWAIVEAYRDDPATTWAERVIIDSASQWVRMSENIAFFAYLLGLTDPQVDDLFRAAALIEA